MATFDIEADSLWPTKIHVLSYWDGKKPVSLTDYDDMRKWLLEQRLVRGHNVQRYDLVHLERLLGITVEAQVIDTLALSWYLFPDRIRHGLESWGETFGIPKPVVKDWENQPIEVYIHRCEQDVINNERLWIECRNYLARLYDCSIDDVEGLPIIRYLAFKMDCAREQERSKWKLDKTLAQTSLEALYSLKEPLVATLTAAMPKVPVYTLKTRPAKPFKKDGTWSSHGANWFKLLRDEGLPEDFTGEVKVVTSYKEPNPNSHAQIKDWLFSLGWEPLTLKYEKDDNGEFRTIPQVRNGDKELCESVLDLVEVEPAISALDGITVASHRISILEGFLKNVDEEGLLMAEVQGFTNTLRFKHTTIVNLPGVDKPWGKEVRGSLVAREGHELCGSDMASLEDNTKRHYMFPYDPEYVKEMAVEGYDPHLSLALFAGKITQKDYDDYQQAIHEVVKKLKPVRKKFKVTNYSATYGVGKDKLARDMKTSVGEAKELLDAYWRRNWSVRAVAEACEVKTVNGQMWLFNPVSKFWYSLRFDKDRFSTLNQSTGVYCFDTWIKHVFKKRKQLTASFHDEIILEIKEGHREECTKLLREALEATNKQLNLNVQLGIDVQYGKSYSNIH